MDLREPSLVKAMLDRSVVLGIGLMIALLGIGAVGSYRSIQSLRRNAEWVNHTHEVEQNATDLEKSLFDSVLQVRGYCLHGDDASRDAIHEGLSRSQAELQNLKTQTSDNPEQQARIQAIRASAEKLRTTVQELETLKSQGSPLAAMATKDSSLTLDLDETRSRLLEFRTEESRLLMHREEDVGAALQTILISSVILFGMGLVLFSGIIELIRRNATTQEQQQLRILSEREQLTVTLANIDDAVVTVDPRGKITQWNLPAERLAGVSSAVAIGQHANSILKLVDELTAQPVALAVEEVLRTGVTRNVDSVSVVSAIDQRSTPVSVRISPVLGSDQTTEGAVIAIRDLNELRQLERSRTERARILSIRADIGLIVSHAGQTSRQLQTTATTICERLAAAATVIWIADSESRTLTRAAQTCTAEWEFIPTPLSADQNELLAGILPQTDPQRIAITSDQCELKWIGLGVEPQLHMWALPLCVEDHPLGVLAVYTLQPLSELTSSELSLVGAKISQFIVRRRTEEERQASEEMFRTLANSIPQLAWMARPDGFIFWYNQRWYDYTGTTLEQMQGWGWQSVHDPNELPHVLSTIKESFATGKPWEDTFPLRRHDGEFRWHLSRMLPVKDDQGRIRLWFGTNTDVTEQRNAEQRLRRVIDSMFSFVGILSPDGTLVETNQAPLIAAGLTRDDVIGRRFWDCHWWNYRDDVQNRIHQAFQRAVEGEWVRYDEEMQVKDNQHITIDVQFQPVFDGGKLLFVIPSGVDVTSRRRAEERLAASEKFLSSVLNGLASHIAVLDERGVILMVNDAWMRFADQNGLAASHYSVGQNYLEICAPATANCPAEAMEAAVGIRAVLEGKQPWFQMEYPCHSLTEKRWFQMRVDRLASPDSLRVVVSHENISARVLSEEATKFWSEQHRRLAEIALQLSASRGSEEILKSAARGARTLIHSQASETVQWDTNGSIASILEDLGPTTSTTEASILAATAWMRDQIRQSNQPLILSPKEARERSATSAQPQFDCLAVPLTNQIGQCIGTIRISGKFAGEYTRDDEAILVQLAQMTSVSLERASLYETIRQADERKDQFLAMLAHELRNPLSAISSATQLLQLCPDDAAQVQSTSELALRQCDHLKQLVDDLLDVSRISRGKLNIQTRRILLQDVIQHALETSQPAIALGKHRLTSDIVADPVYVNGDAVRLAQAVSNLIVNAAKYTPPGGQVSVRVRATAEVARIEVFDNGIGIPKAMLEQIFEMFTQVDASHSRSQGGLGIGLSLARTLVQMHGGTIQCFSDGENQGSTFTIQLPVVGAPDRISSNEQNAQFVAVRKRVLVVDDNRAAVHLLGRLLTTLGHEVETAHDGLSALGMIEQYQPEVVISDIGMPGMSGYELASSIRRLDTISMPVLIALSGYGQSEDRQAAFDAGFRFHLTKPVSLADLEKLMQELSTEG